MKEDIPSSEFTEVKDWFCSHITPMNRMEGFQLIHNKINRGNVIWCPDRDAMFLLDFATLQYGYRGKDIVQAEWAILKNKPELVSEFQDEYFSHFPGEAREQYGRLSPFYHAYYHLSKCAVSLRRNFEKKARQNAENKVLYKKFLSHWNTLLSLVRKS
jgi:aminoglycoside phosphotransferase (APT) family kinase protein